MNKEKRLYSEKDIFIIECDDIFLREYQVKDLDDLYTITQQNEVLKFAHN